MFAGGELVTSYKWFVQAIPFLSTVKSSSVINNEIDSARIFNDDMGGPYSQQNVWISEEYGAMFIIVLVVFIVSNEQSFCRVR